MKIKHKAVNEMNKLENTSENTRAALRTPILTMRHNYAIAELLERAEMTNEFAHLGCAVESDTCDHGKVEKCAECRTFEWFLLEGARYAARLMWEARSKPERVLLKTWQREAGFRHWWNAKRHVNEVTKTLI